jgi:3-oxoacyl-[acyl-carrier-protein] synthase II
MNQRILITGCGQVSPLGESFEQFDASWMNGHSPVTVEDLYLEGLDPMRLSLARSGFLTQSITTPSKLPADRSTAMALHAVKQAWANANIQSEQIEPERLGVFWGSGMGGAASFDATAQLVYAQHKRLRPTTVVTIMPNAAASEIALLSQARASSQTYANACASSAIALGEALRALRVGEVDMAIAGGSESMLSPGVMASWHALRVMASPKDPAHTSCRPFDLKRDGFALGEGSAAFILETEAHAIKRGAQPQYELCGYAISSDASHITMPNSSGQTRAIMAALKNAGLKPQDIGYVNAHGTATQAGDLAEAQSLNQVFGPAGVAVSSTKGLHGHLLGAGGAIELLIALRALQHQTLPISANCIQPDAQLQLDLVLSQSRPVKDLRYVMSNSFAFGGTNAVLIAGRL